MTMCMNGNSESSLTILSSMHRRFYDEFGGIAKQLVSTTRMYETCVVAVVG